MDVDCKWLTCQRHLLEASPGAFGARNLLSGVFIGDWEFCMAGKCCVGVVLCLLESWGFFLVQATLCIHFWGAAHFLTVRQAMCSLPAQLVHKTGW